MTRVRSFPPVAGRAPRVLILGSVPGEASLKAGRYYAHSRNSFWRIISELLGAPSGLSYRERLLLLKRNGIALWDVLGSCARSGSSDSAIEASSPEVNDIPGFLKRRTSVCLVCLNGRKAEEYFRKDVLPALKAGGAPLKHVVLPSTSPANAGMNFTAKLKAWRRAVLPVLQRGED